MKISKSVRYSSKRVKSYRHLIETIEIKKEENQDNGESYRPNTYRQTKEMKYENNSDSDEEDDLSSNESD